MKLLLDENLSRRLVPFLQNEFPGSIHVISAGLEAASDQELWRYAKDNGYVIVTRDADFEELSSIFGAPPQVVWIRMPNQSKAAVLNLLLMNSVIIEESLRGSKITCIELGIRSGLESATQVEQQIRKPSNPEQGFTLIELAIVLFVVALLLGGMLLPLAAQQDIRNYGDTQKILAEARDALLGFAMANDRLPCPASDTSNGQEVFCTTDSGACTETPTVQPHGRCAKPYDGLLPAATMGLSPVDAQGYRLDGWGGETVHRLRYAVTVATTAAANTNAFTAQNGMKTTTMTELKPDLEICNSGAQIRIPPIITVPDTVAMYCHPSFRLAKDAVAVVYSLGKNAGTGGASTDELPNVNVPPDRAFVNAAQGSNFDDQMVWLSKNTLFNRMVAAGRLP